MRPSAISRTGRKTTPATAAAISDDRTGLSRSDQPTASTPTATPPATTVVSTAASPRPTSRSAPHRRVISTVNSITAAIASAQPLADQNRGASGPAPASAPARARPGTPSTHSASVAIPSTRLVVSAAISTASSSRACDRSPNVEPRRTIRSSTAMPRAGSTKPRYSTQLTAHGSTGALTPTTTSSPPTAASSTRPRGVAGRSCNHAAGSGTGKSNKAAMKATTATLCRAIPPITSSGTPVAGSAPPPPRRTGG